jgi:hypothetical protein
MRHFPDLSCQPRGLVAGRVLARNPCQDSSDWPMRSRNHRSYATKRALSWRQTIRREPAPRLNAELLLAYSLAYYALACLRIGMSGSASFQNVRNLDRHSLPWPYRPTKRTLCLTANAPVRLWDRWQRSRGDRESSGIRRRLRRRWTSTPSSRRTRASICRVLSRSMMLERSRAMA